MSKMPTVNDVCASASRMLDEDVEDARTLDVVCAVVRTVYPEATNEQHELAAYAVCQLLGIDAE